MGVYIARFVGRKEWVYRWWWWFSMMNDPERRNAMKHKKNNKKNIMVALNRDDGSFGKGEGACCNSVQLPPNKS